MEIDIGLVMWILLGIALIILQIAIVEILRNMYIYNRLTHVCDSRCRLYWETDDSDREIRARVQTTDYIEFPTGVKHQCLEYVTPRWATIRGHIRNTTVRTVDDIEKIIGAYYNIKKPLKGLQAYVNSLTRQQKKQFFSNTIPNIQRWALQLSVTHFWSLLDPVRIPQIPLIKQKTSDRLTLNQQQIVVLLANLFFCTWPAPKSPRISDANFYSLFTEEKNLKTVVMKLKCIVNYFEKMTKRDKFYKVKFQRYSQQGSQIIWENCSDPIDANKIAVCNFTRIENFKNALQVIFSDKNIGGNVLTHGLDQQEIMFMEYPELLVTRLFIEDLTDGEVIYIKGLEKFQEYSDKSSTGDFAFNTNFIDNEDFSDNNIRLSYFAAMYTKSYKHKPEDQYLLPNIEKELETAYVAFDHHDFEHVSTGSWGCGQRHRGDKELKFIIQLIAAVKTNKHIYYSIPEDKSFNNRTYQLISDIQREINVYGRDVTIGALYKSMSRFCESPNKRSLYDCVLEDIYGLPMQKSPTSPQPGPSGYARNAFAMVVVDIQDYSSPSLSDEALYNYNATEIKIDLDTENITYKKTTDISKLKSIEARKRLSEAQKRDTSDQVIAITLKDEEEEKKSEAQTNITIDQSVADNETVMEMPTAPSYQSISSSSPKSEEPKSSGPIELLPPNDEQQGEKELKDALRSGSDPKPVKEEEAIDNYGELPPPTSDDGTDRESKENDEEIEI